MRKELDAIQNRLSKLIDMHLDGAIDSDAYHFKLEEYKKRQREIAAEMAAHLKADETSSKLSEKQQLLNLVFSNLKLDGKKLLVTLREPFLTLCAMSHQPANLLLKLPKQMVQFSCMLEYSTLYIIA